MNTKKFFSILTVVAVLFTACDKDDPIKGNFVKKPVKDPIKEEPVKKEIFGGYAQKGPFVAGSSVTISELRANLDQTGKTYSTTISDNSGSFEQRNIELVSSYVELKADGYYFNEVSGETSTGQMTLYALADITNLNSANVNVVTHLEKPRVEYLVKQGSSFSAAKRQAQQEVLAIFGFTSSDISSETLNLTNNAMLLAISSILQGYLSTGDMMELMANISADIKTDGILNNTALGSKLVNNAIVISPSEIRNNLAAKYAQLGINVNIPDFETYIQSFINSNLYQQTSFITYPATGLYGANILSDNVTFVQADASVYVGYSVKADVPKGMTLKIVIKSPENPGIPGITYSTILNWNMKIMDGTINRYFELTVLESGKPSDAKLTIIIREYVRPGDSIMIEYYENGATTPTKTKVLQVL